MAHASGIVPDQALADAMGSAKEGRRPRFLKLQIDDDKLVLRSSNDGTDDPKSDFALVSASLDNDVPCYILFRVDGSSRRPPEEWLLMSWVPENAKVRLKMIYASSRDALKKEFGYSNIACEMHACERSEATWEEFERVSLVSETDRLSVMSDSERARLKDTHLETGGVKTAYIHSVQFPLSEEAKTAVSSLSSPPNGRFLILKIEPSTETVALARDTASGGFADFKGVLSGEHATDPRYSLFLPPSGGGATFVFSCPECAPVRTKMLYSTAKSAVLSAAESIGVTIARRMEAREMDDVTEKECCGDASVGGFEEAQPAMAPAVAGGKPKGPGRGRRGITGVPVLPTG